MRSFFWGVVFMWVIVLVVTLFGTTAKAAELHLLSLEEMSFEIYDIADHQDSYMGYQDPDHAEAGEEAWLGGFAANFDVDLLKYSDWGLYWLNRVHGEGTNAQVRQVGWEYELGLQLGPKLELYWLHHSQHVLDAERDDHYPLDNFYGARLTFYRRK